MRKVKDAVDLTTNEKIYFKGHAKATYLSDGRNVEEAISNLPSGEPSVFEAEYGVTTYEEIVEAYKAKKHVICLVGSKMLSLVDLNYAESKSARFTGVASNHINLAFCNSSNQWYEESYVFELQTNKTKTISEASTDAQYPSAKAVHDFVNNTLGTIINGDY